MRAYRNAAEAVRSLPRALSDAVAGGEDLSKLAGIGKDLAEKIAEIVQTGSLGLLDEIGKTTPATLADLLSLPGLGPKRVALLHAELGIETREDLARAARDGRIRSLAGFGPKTEARLRSFLERGAPEEGRTLWSEAEPVAQRLVEHLARLGGVEKVEIAGSLRRRKETVGDLDVLVTCKRGVKVADHFVAFEDVETIVARGSTRSTVVLRSGLQVDLRVVPPVSYGAALFYFTGSKAHNVAVRKIAVRRRLKINEYGVFRGKSRVAGRTEAEVYRRVGLPYIEPELRENRGEIEAARRKSLPDLIELGDIRGDLHTHTLATDGTDDIVDMARAAKRLGYAYVAISDHTVAARIAGGLDARAMRRHLIRIEKANGSLRGIRILKSAEVDILRDGSLDLPASVLADLDLVVAAVHSSFAMSRERQTERILRAMDDPHVHVLAHPTGRLLGEREAYAVDVERLIEGAVTRGCFLELNAQPSRMDLPDVWCKAAKDAGAKIAISTDAHAAHQLDFMRLGVGYARRGWLERGDVLNTRTATQLERLLRKRR